MFEYHGWITIRQSPGEEDDEGALPASLLSDIDALITSLREGTGLAHLQVVNGDTQIHLGGHTNHRGSQGDEVIETFGRIASMTPGSYGLLYVWDSEDPDGRRNEFRAFVMRRGRVTRQADTFLSPCVPTIEDGVI